MGVAVATVAPAASDVCGVKIFPKAVRTRADPRSRIRDHRCTGGLRPSGLGHQTTRICSCRAMGLSSGGSWVWPGAWVRSCVPGCLSHTHSLLAQGGHPFPAWSKKSIFWRMCWPGKRLLAPTHCGTASPGVSACSPTPTTSCSGAGDSAAARPCTPGCPGAALLRGSAFSRSQPGSCRRQAAHGQQAERGASAAGPCWQRGSHHPPHLHHHCSPEVPRGGIPHPFK